MSWNAECKCNSEAALDTIIACVESSFPVWNLLFLSEADSVSSNSFEILHPKFKLFRHWPGPGSRSMCFVVRDPLSALSFSRTCRNRVLALEIWSQGPRKPTSIYVLGVHGPHEEIIEWHDF